MAPSPRNNSERNKLLHRFYEPLVLLFALDPVQGDHLYSESDRISLNATTPKELRRRFLDSLAYICDSKKGGDTITAIGAANSPLQYYVACNKTPKEAVKPFLESIFSKLAQIYTAEPEKRVKIEKEILESCALFSEKRIKAYWRFLQLSLRECSDVEQDISIVQNLRDLGQQLENSSQKSVELCEYCYSLMRPSGMNFIREKADRSISYGDTKNPFVAAKHYIGRLAFHVRTVRVLVTAAAQQPQLVLDPEIKLVNCPPTTVSPPSIRQKLHLDGIAHRMVAAREQTLLSELQERLQTLDRQFNVQERLRKNYGEKNSEAHIHAELIILEYFYEHEQTLQYLDNDRFIGCSKPACYCCSLYIREHPALLEPPATHQKIYLNWLPPTSVPGVEDPTSDTAIHESTMLNKMVEHIRSRAIEQIKSQTGRRQSHFDSITGGTASTRAITTTRMKDLTKLPIEEGVENDIHVSGDASIAIATEVMNMKLSTKRTDSDADSDDGGGVPLL